MGFSGDLCDKAFKKVKKMELQEVLDQILQIQSEDPHPAQPKSEEKPTEEVTWKVYNCE